MTAHCLRCGVWHLAAAFALLGAAACSPDKPVSPKDPCVGAAASADLTTLSVFEGTTIRGPQLGCVRLAADAEYILLPQFLGADLPYAYRTFLIGARGGPISSTPLVAASRAGAGTAVPQTAQEQLHATVRAAESRLRPDAQLLASRAVVAAVDPGPRQFSVLASLVDASKFTNISATPKFTGARVVLYVDDRAAGIYTDDDIAKLGAQFSDVLFDIDRASFGQESDIDGNGRVIVLLTPAVNALVPAADCASFGFATGFFYGFDLASSAPESNRAEVIYAMTADPTGSWSCPHTKTDVAALLPATMIHEFQHMISYNYHVLTHGGAAELPWLNEGLSHMAEELGSLYYEAKYPPPLGRTNATQLFPDSASSLIIGDVFNSYRYLRFSEQYSIVSCAPTSFCYTPERGAAWLFLRWLADATNDPGIFAKLVQSDKQGRQNVEAVVGRPFEELFGDFALALWADSIVGSPRSSVGPRNRFASRNLRRLYSALYDAYGPLGGVPQRFPISPIDIPPAERFQSAIRPGSVRAFRLRTPRGGGEVETALTAVSGEPLTVQEGAQLSILRVPPQ